MAQQSSSSAGTLTDAASWKQRFRAPQVLTSAIAWTAPTRGIAATNLSGTYQLYRWDVATGALDQLTHRAEGIVLGTLAPDGRSVYYFDDHQGQEIGHFVRVPYDSHDTGGMDDPQDITPAMPLYSLASSPGTIAVSRAGNRLAFVAAYEPGMHLIAIDVRPDGSLAPPATVFSSAHDMLGPALSAAGDLAVIASDERTGKARFSLRVFDLERGAEIAELWDGPDGNLELIAFSPVAEDSRLLAVTTRTGIETLLIWDPRTGQRTDLQWPEVGGATRAFDWSPDGTRIVLRTFQQAAQQFYVYHVTTDTLTRLAHPPGTYRNAFFPTNDEIFVHHSDSDHATRLVALDTATGALRRTLLAAGRVAPGHPWRSITFPSSDGTAIQGWLGVPDGAGPYPTILEAHGGPFNVQTNTFAPESQAWLDHGYAYLTINYRGSTTFGRAFQEQIEGHPGEWEVEDLAAARDWLVREGIAEPRRILLTGESYGGYLTLQTLGRKPDLWAGGMALRAITDWRLAYEDTSETMRVGFGSFFGGTPDEKPEQYAASSPITYLPRITAPILIIQGRNDSRTPARPVEEFQRRMAAAGKPIEVEWYDTGHLGGLMVADEGIRHQELMLAFAQRVLGVAPGRRSRRGLLGALRRSMGRSGRRAT